MIVSDGESTHRYQKKHVHLLAYVFEARCVIRELVPTIRSSGVSQEYALHLIGEFRDHGWVVSHHIAITCIRD